MKRSLQLITFGAFALSAGVGGSAQSLEHSGSSTPAAFNSATTKLPELPPAPPGKSTILGGEILNVDPVRDQLSLRPFGEKPMKILFDERTRVYRDGKTIPLRELGREFHASVQTVLDGTDVFALSIHILSQAPQGECEGQIVSFNPGTGELSIGSALSPEPIRLLVPANTLIARMGQTTFTSMQSGASDLAQGALVTARFVPDQHGRPVATQISILATPGSQFILAGTVSFLDFNSGQLDLVDPRDEKRYQVSFDPSRTTGTRHLRMGDQVRIVASYQATRYVASDITVSSASPSN